jgi:hypothetical protein
MDTSAYRTGPRPAGAALRGEARELYGIQRLVKTHHIQLVSCYVRCPAAEASLRFGPGMTDTSVRVTTLDVVLSANARGYVVRFSKPAKQNQDQHDNEYEAEPAATVVAGSVERAAPEPAKAPE